MTQQSPLGYQFPKDIEPGRDKLVLEDGTAVTITASYALGDRWAVDTVGAGMVQMDPNVRVRVQRPA
jgi:hypothetical protein